MKLSDMPRTSTQASWLRHALICAVALVSLAGCANQTSSLSLQGEPLSGYVWMTQVEAPYLGSGNGGGVLKYKGDTYAFSVGGLRVRGIGVSKIEARGELYGLQRLSDFAGAYVQARNGFVLGQYEWG